MLHLEISVILHQSKIKLSILDRDRAGIYLFKVTIETLERCQVNNKGTRTTSSTMILFLCFHSWLWISKCIWVLFSNIASPPPFSCELFERVTLDGNEWLFLDFISTALFRTVVLTSMMELFYENSYRLWAVNYFSQQSSW